MKSLRAAFFFLTLLIASHHAGAQMYAVGPYGPPSVALGGWTIQGYLTGVYASWDVPAAGVPFRYWTDPACGAFETGAEASGITDHAGTAEAPRYTGLALTVACPMYFQADGMEQPLTFFSVYVFDPAAVQLTTVAPEIDTIIGTRFGFNVWLTIDGNAVDAYPVEAQVTPSPSGASAMFARRYCEVMSGRCTLWFDASDRPGNYSIRVSYAGNWVDVLVKQRNRAVDNPTR